MAALLFAQNERKSAAVGFFLLHTLRIPEFRQALRLCFTKRRAAIQTDEIEGKKTNGCTFNDGERVQDITNCSHSRVKRV